MSQCCMTGTSIFNKYWIIGAGIGVNHLLGVLTLLFYRDVSTPFFLGMITAGFLQTLGPNRIEIAINSC